MSPINDDEEIMSEFLAESYENLDQLERDLVVLEKEPANTETIAKIFRTIHTIKGTSGFLGLNKLESISHTGENLLSKVRDGKVKVSAEIITVLLTLMDALRKILNHVDKDKNEGEENFASLVDDLKRLQNGGDGAPEMVPVPKAVVPPPPPAVKVEITPSQHESNAPSSTTEASIRVNVSLLDKLMNLVGELVLARNQVLQYTSDNEDVSFLGTSQRLNLITTELQEGIMKTRMQPIDNIWNKLPRVVRDLSQSCGKKVVVEMEGKETELDKTLIESIKDPLTHLVRNAVDHGIESADVRAQKGKPAEGRLVLKAYHEGGQVNIEISDDGGGLNVEKIKQKVLERNVVTAEQLSKLSDREIIQLIYLPGFSTAEKVTNVSGRGVGLDVVKTNIEKIGGTIDTQSRPGQGTTFKIKIPLTLAIIPALVVRCGRDQYAIPQVSLLELVSVGANDTEKNIEMVHGAPVYRLRGNLLPLVNLRHELKIEPLSPPDRRTLNIVVLQADEHPFGLVVDEVNDTEEIVVKPIGKQLKGIQGFSGATIMGDGRVALILDVIGLAQRAGILTSHRDRSHMEKHVLEETHSNTQTMLLFGGVDNTRLAIPLSVVERLEEFPRSAIERTSGQAVVQYRGAIMPLIEISGAQSLFEGASQGKSTVQVIVYAYNKRNIGLVVSEILDIVEADNQLQKVSGRPGVLGSLILQHRTTDVLNIDDLIRQLDPTFLETGIESSIAA